MPCLRIKLPENKGEITHVLAGERITIGRRPDNTIQIVDRTVSAHHAELIAANGHYRLHDLGSTNLTCVDGQPVTDYHLHEQCKVSFGTVECEYSLETPKNAPDKPAEIVPTRAELEFLRRENLDLQAKIASQQKQIDILSSARLMTKETAQLGIAPELHKRVSAERDQLKGQVEKLTQSAEDLRADLTAMARERDAMRQAWETVKAELAAAQAEIAAMRQSSAAAAAPAAAASVPLPPPPPAMFAPEAEKTATSPINSPDGHRAMATVLTKAPAVLDSLREAIKALKENPAGSRDDLLAATSALLECTAAIRGQPVQRLAASIGALAREIAPQDEPLDSSALRTLMQGTELVRTLLEPKNLKRAKDIASARVLTADSDSSLAEMISAALSFNDISTTTATSIDSALAAVRGDKFDLILADLSQNGELPAKLREIDSARKTPIVALSGHADGVQDSLSKPVQIVELTLKSHVWIFRNQFGLD